MHAISIIWICHLKNTFNLFLFDSFAPDHLFGKLDRNFCQHDADPFFIFTLLLKLKLKLIFF